MGEMVAMEEMGRKEKMGKVRHIVYKLAHIMFTLSYLHSRGRFYKGSKGEPIKCVGGIKMFSTMLSPCSRSLVRVI